MLTLNAGNEAYIYLMPWAMKMKPRKGHTALGQADSKGWSGA